MVLKLKKKHLDEIAKLSKKNTSVESCGILVGEQIGEEKIVTKIYPTANILVSPTEYMIDPVEQLRIYDKAEIENFEIIGFYHSHIREGPYWSDKDENESKLWIGYSFLIYSLETNTIKVYTRQKDGTYEDKIKTF